MRERAFTRVPETVPRNRPPRRHLPAVAAALVVVAIASTAILLTGNGDESTSVGRPTREQMRSGTWTVRRAPALAALSDVHAVRGGDRLYVVGRRADDAVGVVSYDLRSREWTVLPDSPLRTVSGFPNHAIAWSGRELVVLVTFPPVDSGPMMAAFDPRSERWRTLPSSPLPSYSGDLRGGRGGDVLLVVGVDSAGQPSAVFDFRTERWSPVPVAQLIGGREFGVTSDGHLLAVAKQYLGRDAALASGPPYDAWAVVAPSDVAAVASPMGMARVGRRTFLVSRAQGGWMHVDRLHDGWEREGGVVQMRNSSVDATAVIGGAPGLFVGSKEHVSWYDPVGQAWTKLRPAPREVEIAAWTGRELLALTGRGSLATYSPAR